MFLYPCDRADLSFAVTPSVLVIFVRHPQIVMDARAFGETHVLFLRNALERAAHRPASVVFVIRTFHCDNLLYLSLAHNPIKMFGTGSECEDRSEIFY